MSLRVDDRSGRSRAKSPGRGERERSRSNVRTTEYERESEPTGYGYAPPPAESRRMPGSFGNERSSPPYEVRSPSSVAPDRSDYSRHSSSTGGYPPTMPPAGSMPYPYPHESEDGYARSEYKDDRDRPGYHRNQESYPSQTRYEDGGRGFRERESSTYEDNRGYREREPSTYADEDRRFREREPSHYSRHNSYDSYPPQPPRAPQPPGPPQAPRPPQPGHRDSYSYHNPEPISRESRSQSYQYEYAKPPEKITYTARPAVDREEYFKDAEIRQREQARSDAERKAELYEEFLRSKREGEQREPPHRAFSTSSYEASIRSGEYVHDLNVGQHGHARPEVDQKAKEYEEWLKSTHGGREQHPQHPEAPHRSFSASSYDSHANANVVDITPYDALKRTSTLPNRPALEARGSAALLAASAGALAPRIDHLSVGGPKAIGPGEHGLPPPSPLLEAYHGTYQQMSPLPLTLRPHDEDELSELEPLSPTISHASLKGGNHDKHEKKDKHDKHKKQEKEGREVAVIEKKRKSVVVYDPEEDAKKISKALSRSHVEAEVINDILPVLAHDQIVYLRKEYKKQVKVQGKGVNLSKHLKTKLTGNFGKAAYVTALGRWESEGYWANFFYQSHGSRRELLIEALMGRSNAEIWNIKDEFKDKRYADDLVKCMEKELKMDKFRTAVLLVLEERRQEEQDVYPAEYRNKDVETLHRALTAPKGGESTMLEIIVLRSDAHLREVIKTYERVYGESFPRAALKKSNNLVGEVIAHILNGVINKPARDALLLRHAIEDVAEKNKEEELRYELLISRLVRLHWDKLHLLRVKREYEAKYKKTLEEDIEDATKGDLCEFMTQLCQVK